MIVISAAYELALKFADDSDIPKRFKKEKSEESSKQKSDSLIEKRFQEYTNSWTHTINSILKHVLDTNQAWRFIKINPQVADPSIASVTLCKDFLDFTDLLIQRRDIDMCEDDELGKLCLLHNTFQKEIEKRINQRIA